ncbi:MAG: hypothetical protein K0Q53_934, partial [Massilibacillus sp.]|nr:hypothetical protein [Massilibacillus sp.]
MLNIVWGEYFGNKFKEEPSDIGHQRNFLKVKWFKSMLLKNT